MACTICNKKGLSILPARYCIVPSDVEANLPGWAKSTLGENITLPEGYKYALRVVRNGYIYLYFEGGLKDAMYPSWECYYVNDAGLICQKNLDSAPSADVKGDPSDCNMPNHNPSNLEFISIDGRKLSQPVYIAYTEMKWSKKIRDKYENLSQSERSQRMTFIPPPGNFKQQFEIATLESIQSIADYTPNSKQKVKERLQSDQNTPLQITRLQDNTVFSYEESLIKRHTTMFPWPMNKKVVNQQRINVDKDAEKTLNAMKDRVQPDSPYQGMIVVALTDAFGVAKELQGWANEPYAMWLRFGQECEREVKCMSLIEEAKYTLDDINSERRAKFNADYLLKMDDKFKNITNPEVLKIRLKEKETLTKLYEKGVTQDVLDGFKSRFDDAVGYVTGSPTPYDISGKDAADAVLAEINYKANEILSKDEVAGTWEIYASKLKQPLYDNFTTMYSQIAESVTKLTESRAILFADWVNAYIFNLTLHDFDDENIDHCWFYERLFDYVIAGLDLSEKGKKKLAEWCDAMSTEDYQNFFWRGIAVNNIDAMASLEPILKEMKEARESGSITYGQEEALINRTLVRLKDFIDTHKKLEEKNSANQNHPANTPLGKLSQFFDRAGLTLTQKFIDPMQERKTVHAANNIVFKAVMLGRAMVVGFFPSISSVTIEIENDLSYSKIVREHYIKLQTDLETVRRNDTGGKTYQLSRVNTVIAAVNIYQLIADKEGTAFDKSLLTLYVAGALSEVVLEPMNLLNKNDELTAYRKTITGLKLLAGMASSVAGAADFISSAKEMVTTKQLDVMVLMGVKSAVGFSTSVKGLDDILKLAKYYPQLSANGMIEGLSKQTGKFIGRRVVSYLFTWYAAVGLIVIEFLYNALKDNPLQMWCRVCRFGIHSQEERNAGRVSFTRELITDAPYRTDREELKAFAAIFGKTVPENDEEKAQREQAEEIMATMGNTMSPGVYY